MKTPVWSRIAIVVLVSLTLSCQSGEEAAGDTTEPVPDPQNSQSDQPTSLRSVIDSTDASVIGNGQECKLSLRYTIGAIDPRFGVGESDVQAAMNDVVDLWSTAVDELDVRYSAQANITVQLIYDERQERSDTEAEYIQRISSQEERVNRMQREYDALMETFRELERKHEELRDELTRRIERLNRWVDEVNREGGFGDDAIERLETEQEQIRDMQDLETSKRTELNRMVEQINRKSDRLNEEIDQNNRLVDRYNERFSGEHRFTGGSYSWQGESGTLTVYQFRTDRDLRLVLAHELGHALGLDHVDNPRSIMYSTLSGQSADSRLTLTDEDIEEIRAQCD